MRSDTSVKRAPSGNGLVDGSGRFPRYDQSVRCSSDPALQGTCLYADFCSGRLRGLKRNAAGAWENGLLLDSTLQISSFGEDEAGNVYVADLAGGSIHKLDMR